MKILGIVGSPIKDGNSDVLVKAFFKGAATRVGVDKEVIYLNDLDFKGCQACDSCKETLTSPCALDDEMQPVLAAIKNSDIVVISSPMYMDQVTGQVKIFMDRLNAFVNPDFSTKLAEKKTVLIYSQGLADAEAYAAYFDTQEVVFNKFGLKVVETIVLPDAGPHDAAKNNPEILQELFDLGKKLVS